MRREIDRLMLKVAPRHGKTELASRRYPAYGLGHFPHRQFIAASAEDEMATDIGRDVRNVVDGEEYRILFPNTKLAADSQAAGKWNTRQGGAFRATSVGGSIMGRGADDFIIDDPFKNMEDAQSETKRKRVIEWYQGTVYNRLQPGGAIIIIGHRMHEEDLQGYLIEKQNHGGDKWEIVELPAIAEADDVLGRDIGEALWPEAYPIDALQRIKANSLPRFWSALYQQNPQPDEGTFFRREWFKRHAAGEEPKCNKFGSSDLAVTDGGGDFTEHGLWGVGTDSTIYGINGWWGQASADIWIERKLDLVKEHKPLTWFSEAGVIRRVIEGIVKRRMDERRLWVSVEWITSVNDKPTRARAFQALAANGKVSLPLNPWGDHVLDQLIRFPAGKYDDAVDMCSLIGQAVYETWPAILTKPEQQTRPRDGYSRNRGNGAHSWKTV